MKAKTLSAAALAALFLCSSGLAAPLALPCRTSGATLKGFGNLALVVDLSRRYVRIELPKWPGFVIEYQNGRFGPVYVEAPEGRAFRDSVAQFVQVRREVVQIGYRSPEGELMHVAEFNRSALKGAPCRWKAWDDFALAQAD